MRKFGSLGAIAALLTVVAVLPGCSEHHSDRQSPPQVIDTVATIAGGIADCARLATAEYRVHKIVTFDDKITVRGKLFSRPFRQDLPVGDRKIAIPIDVTLRGYIDFTDFSANSISRRGDKIIITLPDPVIEVSSSRVDHSGVKEFVSPLRSRFSQEEISRLTAQGMDSVALVVPRLGIAESARLGAARVIVPVVKRMGYDERNIIVRFRPSVNDRTILGWSEVGQLLHQKK